jgi:oligoendopeptidase F
MAEDTNGVRTREQVPEKYRWNPEAIYPTAEAWEKDYQRAEKDLLPPLLTYRGKLDNAKTLLEFYQKDEIASRTLEKLSLFSQMKKDEDQTVSQWSEMDSRISSLGAKAAAQSSWVNPELLALQDEKLRALSVDPLLTNYHHSLDMLLKMKAHTLSAAEEELLAGASDFASSMRDIFDKLRIADITFPKVTNEKGEVVDLSYGLYQRLLENQDRNLRKEAFEGMYSAYARTKNTYGEIMQTEVKKNVFYAKARKYSSALDSALSGGFIPDSVFYNLVSTVNSNLTSLHRYVELRRKVMKLDKIHVYDLYNPIVGSYATNIGFEDARKSLMIGLAPLGKQYLDDLAKGFDGRWIDVYETKNKNPGGYQTSTYDTTPYILMNYNETVDAVMTLAHELGHAMNSFYSSKKQSYINADYPIFTAEVASTANEDLMYHYFLKNAKSDDERLYYINQLLEDIRGTFFTQVMYSEFEMATHERVEKGEALSADSLCAIWKDLMVKYFGPAFETDDLATLWWSRIPHFYTAFYVYKYATSIAASHALVKGITEGTNKDLARQNYLDFLAAGGSDYPIEVLKRAGVDMTAPDAVNNIIREFNDLTDEMEKLLKKEGKL